MKYKPSTEELRNIARLKSIFNFPVSPEIFQLFPHVDPEPMVTFDTYADVGDVVLLQEFARKNFKRWWWRNYGFYVEYKTIKQFINDKKI